MSITVNYVWQVEDGFTGSRPQEAYIELTENEAREILSNPDSLKHLLEADMEECFNNSISCVLSDDDTTTQVDEISEQLSALDAKEDAEESD